MTPSGSRPKRPPIQLQSSVRKTPDGDVTYYFPPGAMTPSGIPTVDLSRPMFHLVSRQVLSHRRAQVAIERPKKMSRRDGRPLPTLATDQIPSVVVLLIPEGGPVRVTLATGTFMTHPHEYILFNTTESYVVETLPQPYPTHRMLIHLSPPLIYEVWTDMGDRTATLAPRFTIGSFPRPPFMNNLLRLTFQHSLQKPSKPWLTSEALIRQTIHWLLFHHPHDQLGALGEPVVQPVSDPQIQRALDYLRVHVADRQAVQGAAEAAGMHRNTFGRRMEKALGMSPVEYLQRFRMERAQTLLRESTSSIEEICGAVGYESLSHFRTAFKETTGMNPIDFRARHPPRRA